jgi:thymidylate synthase
MHIFQHTNSVTEAYHKIALSLIQEGKTVTVKSNTGDIVDTVELQNVLIEFKPEFKNYNFDTVRKLAKKTVLAEFLWYMTGIQNANVVAGHLPNWLKYTNDMHGTVESNYGYYWKKFMPNVIETLCKDPHSRRAVFNIYNANRFDLYFRDTPCTIAISFNIRDNKLNMHAHMRSNDIWYGLPIDVFCNSMLHQLTLNELHNTGKFDGLTIGTYIHQADSMHMYGNTDSKMYQNVLSMCHRAYCSDVSYETRVSLPPNITLGNFWEAEKPEIFEWLTYDSFKKHIES